MNEHSQGGTIGGIGPVAPLSESGYRADSISVLEGLSAVRKRPDMYIGGTDSKGLHHLVYEVLDNSIDEALAGFCKNIKVTIHADGSIAVLDDGRGIPVDMHETGRPALEVVMTVLHAGGKFDHKSYKVSGGLHGVGVSVVCALSEELEARVFRDGQQHRQIYRQGKPMTPVEVVGPTKQRGTLIRFKPDAEIFETVEFQYDVLSKRCRELAFLNKGLRITLEDERDGKSDVFFYEDGIKAFIRHQNSKREAIHTEIVYFEKEDVDSSVVVEVALQYNSDYASDTIFTFANNINTEHGGTHLSGFKSALTRTLNKYARDSKVIKDNEALPDGSDYLEGLVAVVSVKLPDPKFESQTKVKLSNTEIEGIVQQIVGEQLGIHLEEHPQTARAILNKASQARAAREAARKARELVRRKSPLQSGSLPGKLADCSSRDADSTELFIVEGDSAGGSAKQGRVREFQAILPIRGKILNVEKTRIDKMLGHQEIQTIISALGTGIGRDDFDLSRLRYGKVIIMTDADVDGSHIRTLLLTFFFRQMPELIEAGKVYIAQPPLFELVPKRGSRKNSRYVQDERAYEETVVNVGGENLVVTIAGSGREIRGEELQKLCRAIRALMRLEERMVRRGIPFLELVGLAREESPKLPTTYVVHRRRGEEGGVRKFLFDSEEAEEFVREIEAEIGREPVVATGEDALETREAADVVIYDLYEHESVVRLSEEIRSFGFSVRTYRLTDREDAAGRLLYEPIAHTRNADERTDEPGQPAYDLVEIFQRVQDQVERRFEVKRFKGLGEMNADQLFETTMNPASRTLLKVTVKDAYKADEYFTILMGNEVEPRRKFIQEHALDAKNLDI